MRYLLISILAIALPATAYMGMGVEMQAYVVGCQTHPILGARVVILGEQIAVGTDKDGFYRFEENLEPGRYTIYAYSDYSEIYTEEFLVIEGMERIDWHIMLCTCSENLSLLTGEVTGKNGSPAIGATVSIDELFLSAVCGGQGEYNLSVPPGEWTVSASGANSGFVEKSLTFPDPDPALEYEPIKCDFVLSQ